MLLSDKHKKNGYSKSRYFAALNCSARQNQKEKFANDKIDSL